MPTLPSLSLHQSRPLCVRTLRYGFYLQSAYIHSSGSVSFLQQMSCYGLWRMQQKLNPLPKTRHHRDIARNQTRLVSGKRKGSKFNAKTGDNAPLLNEHLIAELLKTKKGFDCVSADTFQVRLILDLGRKGTKENEDDKRSNEASKSTVQIVTINEAINIAHEHALDLMEVTLKGEPPVIKAVDFDAFTYHQKRKESKSKAKDGGRSIGDKSLKEFKFRAGIADHDLQRKTSNMIEYLEKGHAVRVTLTARQRMLNEDAEAIKTTLDRVKELVGDKAIEVRGLKNNERGSYGNLLLHPNMKK